MLLQTLQKKLANSDFFGNVAKLMAGTVIAQSITVLASPLLTRIYSPADFGAFALFNAVVSVVSVIATGRYDMAVVVAKDKKQAVNIAVLTFILILCTSSLFLLLSLLFKDNLTQVMGDAHPVLFILLSVITIVFASSYQLLSYWANREKDFAILAKTKVAQNLINVILALLVGYFLNNSYGLMIGLMGGTASAFFLIILKNAHDFKLLAKEVTRSRVLLVFKRYKNFPKYSMPSSFLDTFSSQIPIFFITSLFGQALAGHFGFSYRILSIPIALVGSSIAQVFFQRFSDEYRSKGELKNLIYRTWVTLAIFGVIPCIVLLLAGPFLFKFIFGAEWVTAGEIVKYLAIMQFFVLISSPTSTALVVFGAQNTAFLFSLSSAIYRPAALFLGYYLNDFYTGLLIYVLLEVTQIICYNIIIIRHCNKIQKEKML
ncbi:lipopolysaccharide biosynthesis protein [Pontibacter vulgaris]|uniref:lipopolysaccharide biosynthesis protein n=1 Tax=Pontibacter vulgaris TaxID=2905679 RepID=UPI001FA7D132|nr:oligosaccharide flippase family protein [Pontibacter vulgaris]